MELEREDAKLEGENENDDLPDGNTKKPENHQGGKNDREER